MRGFLEIAPLLRAEAGALFPGLLLALVTAFAGFVLMGSAGALVAGLVVPLALFRISGLIRLFSRYAERLALHGATFRFLARLRLWVFRRLAPLSLGWLRGGDLLSRVTSDVEALDGVVLRILSPLVVLVVSLAALFLMLPSARPAIVVLSIGLVLAFTLSRKGFAAGQESIDNLTKLKSTALDGITGMAELTAFNAGYRQAEALASATAQLVAAQLAEKKAQAIGGAAVMSALALAVVTLLVARPEGLATLVPLFLLLAFSEIAAGVPGLASQMGRMGAAAQRLKETTSLVPAVKEPETALPVPSQFSITFDNVSLAYGPRTALKAVSFSLAPGERVMLIGASGAGKSSLVHLLLRFLEPSAGRILLDGRDSGLYASDAVQERIGFLSQSTRLVSGTVRDNLLLARPDADDAALWQALATAALEDRVRALPLGLDQWIGENGTQLSGGEARRLALAQVILKDAPIWLLDEPTEGIDRPTAESVLSALGEVTRGRTVLFLTHQPDLGAKLGLTRTLRLSDGEMTAS